MALAPGAAGGHARERRSTAQQLEEWLRSYRPEELFDEHGALVPELQALAPRGERRMSANPHANGGVLLRDLGAAGLPRLRRRRATAGRRRRARRRACSARFLRGVIAREPRELPPLRPRRDRLEPARRRLRGHRARVGGRAAADRRPPRARGPRHGGALRAPVPGLARGLPADRPPRPVQLLRGVHPHRRLDVQPAREVVEGDARHPVAAARSPRSTTCSARTSGARITTASRTRIPASSTTS